MQLGCIRSAPRTQDEVIVGQDRSRFPVDASIGPGAIEDRSLIT